MSARDAGDHPNEGLIGKPAVGVTASDIAMGAGEPCLLHMAVRLLSFGYRPKCRDKGTPVLIHADRMEPHLDVIAETRVVENRASNNATYRASGSEPEPSRDAVGADRIKYSDALQRVANCETLAWRSSA